MRYREAYDLGRGQLAAFLQERERDLEARLLLEHVCGTRLETLLTEPERPLTEDEETRYLQLLARRGERIPLAYLCGEASFMGLTFAVNEAVLIPRQDTELLVEEAMQQMTGGTRVLDLCTGSGCVLLSLLHYSMDCEGTGTDLSEEALAVARENAGRLGLSDTASFRHGDLFGALDPDDRPYDLIVSNPPYIRTDVIGTLMPEVRAHEPEMALDGGPDGLAFYRRIAKEAPAHLTIGGGLLMEIGYDQGDAVREILEREGYYEVEVRKDYNGLDRVVSAVRSMHMRTSV
ncbi:MAG: peptide chain release factor N(5)-glutamine methyltransferase [Lachnospiraceae bacterium]|nr:peptide chain release factor N(5)-glutamine methyltransferase [Lachnospiraceae bacterium]